MMAQKGYDVKGAAVYGVQGPLDQRSLSFLRCSVCQLILREPKQVVSCGHRYCKVCINQLTCGSEGPYICPNDQEEFSKCDVHDDIACLKETECLRVDCPHCCTWKGLLLDMEEHVDEYHNGIVLCSQGCGDKVLKKDIGFHLLSQCPKRPSPCQFCKQKFPMDHIQNHYQSCQEVPVSCDFCKKDLPSRREVPAHIRECTECSMKCPYEDCQYKGKRITMNQHFLTNHLIQMVEDTLEIREELKAVKSENRKLHSDIALLTSCKECNVKEIERLRSIVQQLEKERTTINAPQYAEREEAPSVAIRPSLQQPPLIKKSTRSSTPFKNTYPLPNFLQKEICQTQLQNSSHAIQNSLTQYAIAIDEVRLQQDTLNVRTTDHTGKFIWKISDIHEHYQHAVKGKTVSLYILSFILHQTSWVPIRSEHDNLLSWPFKQSVRFTLINQKNPAASITEAFVPDLHSPSFQKPEYDINIASGFPTFAPQVVLHDENFTLNSTVIIHCHIDPCGLALL